jgi:SAM-dependent methyltransferase
VSGNSTSYTDPRLAALYDLLNTGRADWDFYLALAGETPQRVLDVGCGTGGLAVDFARRGHAASGADPAEAMLAIARRRPGGEYVTWVRSGAADLAIETRFDLIVMTGHAFQVLREDAEIDAALTAMRRHLAPGGRLAFETRNGAVRAWEGWVAEDVDIVDLAGHGEVRVGYQTVAVAGPLVTYEIRFDFGGDDRTVATDTLRFMEEAELRAFLARAGFTDVTLLGDWDGSPVGPQSPELIAVAR